MEKDKADAWVEVPEPGLRSSKDESPEDFVADYSPDDEMLKAASSSEDDDELARSAQIGPKIIGAEQGRARVCNRDGTITGELNHRGAVHCSRFYGVAGEFPSTCPFGTKCRFKHDMELLLSTQKETIPVFGTSRKRLIYCYPVPGHALNTYPVAIGEHLMALDEVRLAAACNGSVMWNVYKNLQKIVKQLRETGMEATYTELLCNGSSTKFDAFREILGKGISVVRDHARKTFVPNTYELAIVSLDKSTRWLTNIEEVTKTRQANGETTIAIPAEIWNTQQFQHARQADGVAKETMRSLSSTEILGYTPKGPTVTAVAKAKPVRQERVSHERQDTSKPTSLSELSRAFWYWVMPIRFPEKPADAERWRRSVCSGHDRLARLSIISELGEFKTPFQSMFMNSIPVSELNFDTADPGKDGIWLMHNAFLNAPTNWFLLPGHLPVSLELAWYAASFRTAYIIDYLLWCGNAVVSRAKIVSQPVRREADRNGHEKFGGTLMPTKLRFYNDEKPSMFDCDSWLRGFGDHDLFVCWALKGTGVLIGVTIELTLDLRRYTFPTSYKCPTVDCSDLKWETPRVYVRVSDPNEGRKYQNLPNDYSPGGSFTDKRAEHVTRLAYNQVADILGPIVGNFGRKFGPAVLTVVETMKGGQAENIAQLREYRSVLMRSIEGIMSCWGFGMPRCIMTTDGKRLYTVYHTFEQFAAALHENICRFADRSMFQTELAEPRAYLSLVMYMAVRDFLWMIGNAYGSKEVDDLLSRIIPRNACEAMGPTRTFRHKDMVFGENGMIDWAKNQEHTLAMAQPIGSVTADHVVKYMQALLGSSVESQVVEAGGVKRRKVTIEYALDDEDMCKKPIESFIPVCLEYVNRHKDLRSLEWVLSELLQSVCSMPEDHKLLLTGEITQAIATNGLSRLVWQYAANQMKPPDSGIFEMVFMTAPRGRGHGHYYELQFNWGSVRRRKVSLFEAAEPRTRSSHYVTISLAGLTGHVVKPRDDWPHLHWKWNDKSQGGFEETSGVLIVGRVGPPVPSTTQRDVSRMLGRKDLIANLRPSVLGHVWSLDFGVCLRNVFGWNKDSQRYRVNFIGTDGKLGFDRSFDVVFQENADGALTLKAPPTRSAPTRGNRAPVVPSTAGVSVSGVSCATSAQVFELVDSFVPRTVNTSGNWHPRNTGPRMVTRERAKHLSKRAEDSGWTGGTFRKCIATLCWMVGAALPGMTPWKEVDDILQMSYAPNRPAKKDISSHVAWIQMAQAYFDMAKAGVSRDATGNKALLNGGLDINLSPGAMAILGSEPHRNALGTMLEVLHGQWSRDSEVVDPTNAVQYFFVVALFGMDPRWTHREMCDGLDAHVKYWKDLFPNCANMPVGIWKDLETAKKFVLSYPLMAKHCVSGNSHAFNVGPNWVELMWAQLREISLGGFNRRDDDEYSATQKGIGASAKDMLEFMLVSIDIMLQVSSKRYNFCARTPTLVGLQMEEIMSVWAEHGQAMWDEVMNLWKTHVVEDDAKLTEYIAKRCEYELSPTIAEAMERRMGIYFMNARSDHYYHATQCMDMSELAWYAIRWTLLLTIERRRDVNRITFKDSLELILKGGDFTGREVSLLTDDKLYRQSVCAGMVNDAARLEVYQADLSRDQVKLRDYVMNLNKSSPYTKTQAAVKTTHMHAFNAQFKAVSMGLIMAMAQIVVDDLEFDFVRLHKHRWSLFCNREIRMQFEEHPRCIVTPEADDIPTLLMVASRSISDILQPLVRAWYDGLENKETPSSYTISEQRIGELCEFVLQDAPNPAYQSVSEMTKLFKGNTHIRVTSDDITRVEGVPPCINTMQ